MKRIYLSGPMTALNFYSSFKSEAERLRGLGYEVVNPADLNPEPNTGWHECMRNDLKALLDCDTLALLDGWQQSAGAHLEMHVAHRVGMEIVIAKECCAAARPLARRRNKMIETTILRALAYDNRTLKQLHGELPYSRNYIAMHVRRLVREGKIQLVGMRGKACLYGSMDEEVQPIKASGVERVRLALERMGHAHRSQISHESVTPMELTAAALRLLIKRGLAERVGKGEYRYAR